MLLVICASMCTKYTWYNIQTMLRTWSTLRKTTPFSAYVNKQDNTEQVRYRQFWKCEHSLVHGINTAIEGRVHLLHKHLSDITNILDKVSDSCALDHTISLLSQASSTLKATVETKQPSVPVPFKTTTHFAPAQRNEIQLRFRRSTKKQEERKPHLPYSKSHTVIIYAWVSVVAETTDM